MCLHTHALQNADECFMIIKILWWEREGVYFLIFAFNHLGYFHLGNLPCLPSFF